jgi:CubicO group peptidase (beta-lactamase class C family)
MTHRAGFVVLLASVALAASLMSPGIASLLSPRVASLLSPRIASLFSPRIASLFSPRVALGAPDPRPDPLSAMKDWPKPELRPGLSEPQIAAAITAYARQLHEAGHFSGVVLAGRAGKVVVSGAYGLADIASRTPNTLETRFNIGSINKLFTKVAIAQLAEAGKLSLDDTVRKHLPELALAGADKITIRHLLDHVSGMGDIFGPRYIAAPPSRLRELADFVPLFADQPLAFEPGGGERYSNAGYVTLGLIIERLTGETYRDHVARRVFAPANMTSTGFWAPDEHVARRATGYRNVEGGGPRQRVPNTDTLPGRPSSAGGAFSTAGDLLRLWQAVRSGKLLSPAWTNWMLNGSFDDARRDRSIGLGGGAPGINAALESSDGWIVIALANFDPPSAMAVGRGAIEIIRGQRRTGELRRLGGPSSAPPALPAPTRTPPDRVDRGAKPAATGSASAR